MQHRVTGYHLFRIFVFSGGNLFVLHLHKILNELKCLRDECSSKFHLFLVKNYRRDLCVSCPKSRMTHVKSFSLSQNIFLFLKEKVYKDKVAWHCLVLGTFDPINNIKSNCRKCIGVILSNESLNRQTHF